MPITKIVLKYLSTNTNRPVPAPVELDGSQGALIPAVGDRILGDQFSMDVVLRKFSFEGETLFVFLQDHTH